MRRFVRVFSIIFLFWVGSGMACGSDRPPVLSAPSLTGEGLAVGNVTAWEKYKTTWAEIDGLEKSGGAARLYRRIDGLESSLDTLFPDDIDLVNDLLAILRDKLGVREKMLRKQSGRPPQPDWIGQLRGRMKRLAAEVRVFKRMDAMGLNDPWLQQTLLPDMRLYAQLVDQGIESVRAANPEDERSPEVQSMLMDAKTIHESACAWLKTNR
jgi:hypothetical protein